MIASISTATTKKLIIVGSDVYSVGYENCTNSLPYTMHMLLRINCKELDFKKLNAPHNISHTLSCVIDLPNLITPTLSPESNTNSPLYTKLE